MNLTEKIEVVLDEKSPKLRIPLPLTLSSSKVKAKRPNEECEGLDVSHPTRSVVLDGKTYLEWQIGYDVPVADADMDGAKKETALKAYSFTGSSGREKYPYEVAEILLACVKSGIVDSKELDSLIKTIENNKVDIEKNIQPYVIPLENLNLDGIECETSTIDLPCLRPIIPGTKERVRVNIQKQQYASGYQPMLYLCIPIECLDDHEKLFGRVAEPNEEVYWTISDKNQNVIFYTFRILAMLSSAHKHDVLEILRIAKKY